MDLAFKPRLDTSLKWTPLPQEFSEQILETFEDNFQDSFAKNQFIVQSQIYAEEILLRIGHREENNIRQRNFEASIQYKKEDDLKESIYAAVDMVGSLMADYLQSKDCEGEFHFSVQWQEHKVDDRVIYVKTSSVNTELEAKADKLLGDYADEGLVTEDQVGTDALDHSHTDPELCH